MAVKRCRELRPLSSEHHQALLIAFQLKKAIAGHAETAGAPRDLDGLSALARRFEESVFLAHTEAEEELLGRHLSPVDARRLQEEHRQLRVLLAEARASREARRREPLLAFADLLERHVRWEERELFQMCEEGIDPEDLARIGHELEKRLVVAGRGRGRTPA
jgi:hemerythrin-like domain-containing protein